VNLKPSIRVDEPTLSMVATLRGEVSFTDGRLRFIHRYPLNSSISTMMLKTGGNRPVLAESPDMLVFQLSGIDTARPKDLFPWRFSPG